jgi:hypothetical protein
MKYVKVLLVATIWSCWGTTQAPFAGERRLLDSVSEGARVGSPTRAAALEILERVAEGRMDIASPDLETQVGIKPGEFRTRWFKDGSVRAYAAQKIGEIDVPEALTYLEHLKMTDLELDTTGMVWSAVQIALSSLL